MKNSLRNLFLQNLGAVLVDVVIGNVGFVLDKCMLAHSYLTRGIIFSASATHGDQVHHAFGAGLGQNDKKMALAPILGRTSVWNVNRVTRR